MVASVQKDTYCVLQRYAKDQTKKNKAALRALLQLTSKDAIRDAVVIACLKNIDDQQDYLKDLYNAMLGFTPVSMGNKKIRNIDDEDTLIELQDMYKQVLRNVGIDPQQHQYFKDQKNKQQETDICQTKS